jgi:hypothetical protein
MTVVFFSGGGGLLLLMQPASKQAATRTLETSFIDELLLRPPVSSRRHAG